MKKHERRPPQPKDMPVKEDGIPETLKQQDQWVLWKWVWKKNKWDKPPYQSNGSHAKSNNPNTWSSFKEAIQAYNTGEYSGVGFVPGSDDCFVGVDLDHCVEDGCVKEWTAEQRQAGWGPNAPEPQRIVNRMKSYSEITPSGCGLRVWMNGQIPDGGRNKGDFEIYTDGRYFTVTGHRIGDHTDVVTVDSELIEKLHQYFFPQTETRQRGRPTNADTNNVINSPTVDAILNKALTSANGDTIRVLFDGNWEGRYPSQSEADLALCNCLAFWCDGNASLLNDVFRQSGLYRDKWDNLHHSNGNTYGQETIAKAIASCGETYDWNRVSVAKSAATTLPPQLTLTIPQGRTDVANGQRLLEAFGRDVRYVKPWKKWLCWDGRRWQVDNYAKGEKLAYSVLARLWREFGEEAPHASAEQVKSMLSFVRRSQDGNRLNYALGWLIPHVTVAPEELDAEPLLFNLQNGTLNLRTGQLQAHRQSEMLTSWAAPLYPLLAWLTHVTDRSCDG